MKQNKNVVDLLDNAMDHNTFWYLFAPIFQAAIYIHLNTTCPEEPDLFLT